MGSSTLNPSSKVAVVGTGFVGSTAAYAMMIQGSASEIALIDAKAEKAEGEALDLQHCMQFAPHAKIVAGGSFELVKDAAVVVVTAGAAQQPGQTRTELLEKNVTLFEKIIPQIVAYNKECILLIVTNPLDILTTVTLELSKFPSYRVLGTGTVLDTARLRYLLGRQFHVSPKDVTAYILGEHGDSEFVWWSKATVGGVPLSQFTGYAPVLLQEIYKKTKNAAYEIIAKKGATYYAIALVIAKIVKAIIQDQARVFSVSSLVHNIYGVDQVCISVPTLIRNRGVYAHLIPELDEEEKKMLIHSANKIKEDSAKAIKLLKVGNV